MDASAQNDLTTKLSRQVVAQIAPQELPLFPAISEAYFKDPQKLLGREKGKDDILGFGIDVPIVLLSPAVLLVVQFVVQEVFKSFTGEIMKRIVEGLSGPKTKGDQEQIASPLTPEQLAQVHEVAFQKACELQLPEQQAHLLAESIIGNLSIYPPNVAT
jgi:hypothetical protein